MANYTLSDLNSRAYLNVSNMDKIVGSITGALLGAIFSIFIANPFFEACYRFSNEKSLDRSNWWGIKGFMNCFTVFLLLWPLTTLYGVLVGCTRGFHQGVKESLASPLTRFALAIMPLKIPFDEMLPGQDSPSYYTWLVKRASAEQLMDFIRNYHEVSETESYDHSLRIRWALITTGITILAAIITLLALFPPAGICTMIGAGGVIAVNLGLGGLNATFFAAALGSAVAFFGAASSVLAGRVLTNIRSLINKWRGQSPEIIEVSLTRSNSGESLLDDVDSTTMFTGFVGQSKQELDLPDHYVQPPLSIQNEHRILQPENVAFFESPLGWLKSFAVFRNNPMSKWFSNRSSSGQNTAPSSPSKFKLH